jgi:hypothetical protein
MTHHHLDQGRHPSHHSHRSFPLRLVFHNQRQARYPPHRSMAFAGLAVALLYSMIQAIVFDIISNLPIPISFPIVSFQCILDSITFECFLGNYFNFKVGSYIGGKLVASFQ